MLREGSINWPEVRKAFAEIGYTGYMNTELGGGDEAYLRESIVKPDAKITDGFDDLMPKAELTEEEVQQILDYLKTLK